MGRTTLARAHEHIRLTSLRFFSVVERQNSEGVARVGRGGAANFVKLGSPDIPEVKEAKKAEGEDAAKRTKSPDASLAAKGKEWLFGKKA